MPAIASLLQCGRLPAEFRVLGIARKDWDTERFRRHIGERLDRHAGALERPLREAVLKMLEYRRADVSDAKQVAQALYGINEPAVIYLALPPSLYVPVIIALATVDLPRDTRLVIEKPFGEDLASAQALNQLLHHTFSERQVYRIDHFLHHQTVQNLLGLRFATASSSRSGICNMLSASTLSGMKP